MNHVLIGWAHSLCWGQIILFALLLNDPGWVDGVQDLFLWFFIIPILVAAPFWICDWIRPAKSASRRRLCGAVAGLYPPLAIFVLAFLRALPSLQQLLIAFLSIIALILILNLVREPLFRLKRLHLSPILMAALAVVNFSLWLGNRILWSAESPHPRVLLFGADGADWQIIDALVAKGQLPHIAQGLQSGCRADLMAGEPLFSPILWTTIAAGRPAAEHGLCGRISDLNASYLRCRRVWDIVEARGKTCGAVQYLGLWPLGPSPSRFALPSAFEGGLQSRPAGYEFIARFLRRLEERLSPGDAALFLLESLKSGMRLSTATMTLKTAACALVVPSAYRRMFLQYRFYLLLERLHLDAFCHLYRSRPADLVLYYYPGSDTIQHLFFRAFRPDAFKNVNPTEARWLGDAIPEAYRDVDRALGRALASMGADTRVLLVSDHGMKATTELVAPGCSRVFHGREAFPPLLGYTEDKIEWIQGLDRIYLVPRMDSGITYAELIERAASARREVDGSLIWSVGFRDGWGEFQPQAPRADTTAGWVEVCFRIPDSWADTAMIILPVGRVPVSDLAAPADQIIVQGGHDPRGVFLAWGPGIRRNEQIGALDHLQILPTILALLNLPGARDLRGAAADIMQPELAAALPAPLATYENPPWVRLQLPQEKERDMACKALLEQMRSRGYIN